LMFPIPSLSLYAASVALIFHVFVVLYEEPALVSRFGVSYRDYCRKVPRWGFAFRPFSMNSA
jgi:protein-S-isoprenylcysteine O-methyltransferase Ste14